MTYCWRSAKAAANGSCCSEGPWVGYRSRPQKFTAASWCGVARTLESWGIRKGDRVAILSENRPEWTITDFAVLALGAVTVPIYPTQTSEQTSFILNDSGARVIAVSTQFQLEKVLTIGRAHSCGTNSGNGRGRNGACGPHARD
jgi:non-ribosomal peptide synthetase component E (peptide arylation enzyme)